MCLYCENKKENEHFICDLCGNGMCEDCYDSDVEHEFHQQEILDCDLTDEEYEAIEKGCNNSNPAYLCNDCINKILQQGESL
ncbi:MULTISPECIES: hypothetical protein [Arcobacteraceae]|uniref:hypothetical protein n=1 Tax=Arcobacteraceae TaxID=2808963 RepID=UPI000DB5816B|nr:MULTISPECIES: hypothetical protein [Arcobacteraceae]MCT7591524.1 hypothetical protein [Aliarcobacter butzleri]MCT7910293.1 hypothetical protein [Arcobacter lacus]MDN5061822.1 hypothetical protein [Aliarcobacter butzleri]PZQ08883.1 MAG: hypothetical protein DI567_01495 [Aliarcobacter butzleri]